MMNNDLVNERKKATFNPINITYMIDGSKEQTQRRHYLQSIIENDPTGVFDNTYNNYIHRTERHTRALAKHVRLIEICRQLGIGNKYNGQIVMDPDFIMLVSCLADDLPTALHWIMFVPNIISLCAEEQQNEFLPLIRDWKMIGCYAQTELGHGSNVRALETTATFCKDHTSNNEDDDGYFIINSPTITSTKFWPGTLGRTANTAMVIARLIDGTNVDRGIHNFLVPLRSIQDHTLLPGVTTGDIGPKIGYNGMDNGYAKFSNVKIPRRYMAMKFASIDKNGIYSIKQQTDASSKVAYITMMQVRSYIVNEAGKNLAMACTIVIRYSAVRRQGFTTATTTEDGGKNNTGKPLELQILDYKQQQHRLLPLLASSYCFYFMGKQLLTRLKEIENCLLNTNSSTSTSSDQIKKEEVTDIHASTSALKSYTTIVTANGIEECRKACGGHGYLMSSGLPELFTTYLQNPTVEGDNHMLPQQVTKVLLKLVTVVVSNNTKKLESNYKNCSSYTLVPSMQAILKAQNQNSNQNGNQSNTCGEKFIATTYNDLLDYNNVLIPAFQHRAARLLLEVANTLQTNITVHNQNEEDAWNNTLIEMSRCSRAYSQYLLLLSFSNGIQNESKSICTSTTTIQSNEVYVLQDLLCLLGLYWIEQDIGDYIEDNYMTYTHTKLIRTSVIRQLDKVRPNCIGLVDAWDFSNYKLKNSSLGQYNGNVYTSIMESAYRDTLNSIDPGPGYKEHLHRLIVDGIGEYKPNNNTSNNNNGVTGTASRL